MFELSSTKRHRNHLRTVSCKRLQQLDTQAGSLEGAYTKRISAARYQTSHAEQCRLCRKGGRKARRAKRVCEPQTQTPLRPSVPDSANRSRELESPRAGYAHGRNPRLASPERALSIQLAPPVPPYSSSAEAPPLTPFTDLRFYGTERNETWQDERASQSDFAAQSPGPWRC